jgi:ribosome-binding factor A
MAFRVERVEKIIERELANILFESAHNEKLKFVSVTKVSLTKDLSIATIYYTILGNTGEIEATKKELENAKGYLRTELAHRIDLRKTPELKFKYDESLAYGNHISEILDNLKK